MRNLNFKNILCLGAFLVLASAETFAAAKVVETQTPEYESIEFNREEAIQGNNGVHYCYTALHKGENRLIDWIEYLPCDLVTRVLSDHGSEKKLRISTQNFENLIAIDSNEMPLSGTSLYDAISREFLRLNSAPLLIDSYEEIVAKSFSKSECPQISHDDEKLGNLTNWGFFSAQSKPASEYGSIEQFLQRVEKRANQLNRKNPIKISKADASTFVMRPKCFAKFYQLEQGSKKTRFFVCASSEPIECDRDL